MAVSVYGPTDSTATVPAGEQLPDRVFQTDQFAGSVSGLTPDEADAWLADQRARYPSFYGNRGWLDPRTVQSRCPWAATWYREVGGRLHLYRYNWDSSD